MHGEEPWVLVSNRLPFAFDASDGSVQPASGGLVTAVRSVHLKQVTHWIGSVPAVLEESKWSDVAGQLQEKEPLFSFHPVFIPEDEYNEYYNDMCNDVIWPLLHYETQFVQYSMDAWVTYLQVNQRFARAVAEAAPPNALVWVHDFHLLLLPQMLRELRDDVRIGFFLHVPFPSSEIFRELPVREQILESLLCSDLVGFHDYDYLRHFVNTLKTVLGIESNTLYVSHPRRSQVTRLGVFPVAIDTERIIKCAKSPEVSAEQEELQGSQQYKYSVLGVDRLDYTKGVDLKLLAFENMLERYPDIREHVRLLQVAVPTRTDVPSYQQLREHIEGLVGRINGRFGKPNLVPVHYMFYGISFEKLLALYRNADCLLVTSKRDGMNLVALEYVSAQDESAPGVLCLSEFAGASSYLSHALLVNPWDIQGTADQLYRALTMSKEERIKRHRPMLKQLQSYDATTWAEGFMSQLRQTSANEHQLQLPKKLSEERVLEELTADQLIILLDYDGTTVPIESLPEQATLPPQGHKQIEKWLQDDPKLSLIVISGRDADFLHKQLEGLQVHMAPEHGARYRYGSGSDWEELVLTDISSWFPTVERLMEDFSKRTPGAFVERKRYALAWHYRNAPGEFGKHQARHLLIELDVALTNMPAKTIVGHKVVEARAVEANKGRFVQWFKDNHSDLSSQAQWVVLGDDTTDEDMFAAVPDDAISIRVGRARSSARYCLSDQSQVMPFLDKLIQKHISLQK